MAERRGLVSRADAARAIEGRDARSRMTEIDGPDASSVARTSRPTSTDGEASRLAQDQPGGRRPASPRRHRCISNAWLTRGEFGGWPWGGPHPPNSPLATTGHADVRPSPFSMNRRQCPDNGRRYFRVREAAGSRRYDRRSDAGAPAEAARQAPGAALHPGPLGRPAGRLDPHAQRGSGAAAAPRPRPRPLGLDHRQRGDDRRDLLGRRVPADDLGPHQRGPSQRRVAVLARGHLLALGAQHRRAPGRASAACRAGRSRRRRSRARPPGTG